MKVRYKIKEYVDNEYIFVTEPERIGFGTYNNEYFIEHSKQKNQKEMKEWKIVNRLRITRFARN